MTSGTLYAANIEESLRTEQGIARQQAEADLAAVQADLDALPDAQAQSWPPSTLSTRPL